MVSPVKSRLTHYDSLGLTPAATPDEIAEAFSKQIHINITSPEEAVEHAERIYIAYETLRDPTRRRAYDAAIGLWDREAAAEQKVEPFIGGKAHGLAEHALPDASPGETPKPIKKKRRQVRPPNKGAIEWPVPKTRSFDVPAATHVADTDGGPPGGKAGPAKKDRRRSRRANEAAVNRETSSAFAEQRKSAAEPRAAPIEELPDKALHRAEKTAKPFVNVRERKSPENGRDDPSPGGRPKAAKSRRRRVRRTDQEAIDRETLKVAAEHRRSAAGPGATEAVSEELRGDAIHQIDQAKPVFARQRAPTNRNFAGVGAGVVIATFGLLTLVLALVRGNYEKTPSAPREEVSATGEQPSNRSTGRAMAAREQALPVDQTPSAAKGQASSSVSAAEPAQQFRDTPQLRQQAKGPQLEGHASRKPAAIPSQQSATGEIAATAPQQLQVANQQPAGTPPQQVVYRQTSPAAHGNATTQVDASGKVSSAIGEKICRQLPSSWTRLPQRACLTRMEWKQVEEELR
jgi:curved DNA-binding protein CbpA